MQGKDKGCVSWGTDNMKILSELKPRKSCLFINRIKAKLNRSLFPQVNKK